MGSVWDACHPPSQRIWYMESETVAERGERGGGGTCSGIAVRKQGQERNVPLFTLATRWLERNSYGNCQRCDFRLGIVASRSHFCPYPYGSQVVRSTLPLYVLL